MRLQVLGFGAVQVLKVSRRFCKALSNNVVMAGLSSVNSKDVWDFRMCFEGVSTGFLMGLRFGVRGHSTWL